MATLLSFGIGTSCPVCSQFAATTPLISKIDSIKNTVECSINNRYYNTHSIIDIRAAFQSIPTNIKQNMTNTSNKFSPPKIGTIRLNEITKNVSTPKAWVYNVTPKVINEFPHTCPRCGEPCYIGTSNYHKWSYLDETCR